MTSEEKLLASFLAHPGKSMLLREIAAYISESESNVLRSIEHWKKCGFEFIFHPQLGYSLAPAPDVLHASEISTRLPGNPFAQKLTIFPQIPSTNSYAMNIAPQAEDGTTIVAETQTSGKGRHGRVWESAQPQGIYLSSIFKPDWPFEHTSRLVIIVSVAACRALEKLASIKLDLKWPNDLLLKNSKIGGILTEARTLGAKLAFAVAGIGINVNQLPIDFPESIRSRSTSLAIATGHTFRRADVLTYLLREFHFIYHAPFHGILTEWKDRCVSIGKHLQVHEGSHIYAGIMMGLDDDGFLLLRLDDGRIRTIRSGEILFH